MPTTSPIALDRPPTHRRLRAGAALGLRRDACLALNFRFVKCRDCEHACPVGALRVGAQDIELGAGCTGCGRCAGACTTGALHLEGCEVPDTLPAGATVRVECRKVPTALSSADAVRVPCVEGLAVSQWLSLVAGAEGRPIEVMDRGWCRRCEAGGEQLGRGSFQVARALLAEMRLPDASMPARRAAPLPIECMPSSIPAAQPPVAMSRRGFFGHVARGATATASAASTARVDSAPTTAVRPGALATPERTRRLQMLSRIACRTAGALPASAFPRLVADDRCRNHHVCAALCPTQALRPYRDAGSSGLAFEPAGCIDCGACVTACPHKALSFATSRAASGIAAVTLTRHRVVECIDCGAAAAPEPGSTCPACMRSRDLARDAFASLYPMPEGEARTS